MFYGLQLVMITNIKKIAVLIEYHPAKFIKNVRSSLSHKVQYRLFCQFFLVEPDLELTDNRKVFK